MSRSLSFHTLAEQCLFVAGTVGDKLALIDRLAEALAQDRLAWQQNHPVRPARAVVLPAHPVLVEPRALPPRNFTTRAGLAAFFHALAHIEFTAILLALDMAYRFSGMPAAFYQDWLGVALDETRHFRMLTDRLALLESTYGDLPAHRGLWTTAEETAHDLLARLALVPRCMEARGLDVSPGMILKLEQHGARDDAALLNRIYQDEIAHVALGSYWFGQVCTERGLEVESTYFGLLANHLHGELRGPFNLSARRQAGFSEQELTRLAAC
ncbi:ferritin-like domain-containing protein [Candidatus Woesearchaeota archaeon]|nr:ferritin-like domain-containing protein [Candidatus Woesearchaeota archaeon]